MEYLRTTDPVPLPLAASSPGSRKNSKDAEQCLFPAGIPLLLPAVTGSLGLELRLIDGEETGEVV